MKKILFSIGTALLLSTCGSNTADEPQVDEDSTASFENTMLWQATLNDSTGKMEMKRVSIEGADNSNPQRILASINDEYPEIRLDFLRISHDTAFLKIDDAHYLTQQMGSTGSQMYIAGLVYNLTENPDVHFVNMNFEEGDHAQPGTFSRETFAGQ